MIKTIIHSGDWQYNSQSEYIKNAISCASEGYFKHLDNYSLEYDYSEMLQVICGDVFDKKEKSTIEDFLWVKNFLSKCCEYSEVILTVGNHDFDIHNRDCPSMLRLIIDNFDMPGLKFYEKSGIYEYDNDLSFFVFSNLEHSNPPEGFQSKINPQKINIALYHDPLSDAKDYNPNVKYAKYPSVKMFKGLHCAMMADIHKRQTIEIDENAVAIYCGSPYQRTYGEDVLNHGIVKWNIPSLTYEFVDIENPYNLIKLELNFNSNNTDADSANLIDNINILN